ncbi:MAG: DUF362 domain-containing protein [Synergistaceae bacterium]|nr:DUF362 domain-containing protein [Synergistaceae bacterium]
MGKIYLLSQDSYARDKIASAVRQSFSHFGINFEHGEKVLLKVNLVSGHDVSRRVTTDPEIVRAAAEYVLECGATPFIADSPGIDSFKSAAEKAGFMSVARELNIECRELSDPVYVDDVRPPAPPGGVGFRKIQISRHVLEADKIINLAKLKTHGQMYLTMGVKNLFGCVPGRLKASWHYNVGLDREKFAALLLDIYSIVKPTFTIIDGVIGMDGNGPTSGEPHNFGVIAACVDALTADFWLCKMLGGNFDDYPLYNAAKKRNMPECELDPSDVEGDFSPSHVFHGVKLPKTRSMRLLPRIPFIERLMTSRPVHIPELCIGCGRCEAVCAAHAVRHENKRLYFDYGKCIRCYCCHEMCPVRAIEFKESALLSLMNKLGRV